MITSFLTRVAHSLSCFLVFRKGCGKNSKQSRESYEKTNVGHGDKVLYKFTKTLSDNPSQIIRYGLLPK